MRGGLEGWSAAGLPVAESAEYGASLFAVAEDSIGALGETASQARLVLVLSCIASAASDVM